MDNETRSLPMVALRGLTIMPEMIVHFDVSRERSIAAIQQAMVEEQEIFLVAQKSIETENPGQDDVYETGTVASVKQLIKLSKKVVRVLVEGKNRAVLKKIEETDPYLRAEVEVLEEQEAFLGIQVCVTQHFLDLGAFHHKGVLIQLFHSVGKIVIAVVVAGEILLLEDNGLLGKLF